MSIFIFKDARLYLDGNEFSGVSNKIAVNIRSDVLDATAFNATYKDKRVGLSEVTLNAEGFVEHGDGNAEDTMFDDLNGVTESITVCPDGRTVGDKAFICENLITQLNLFGPVGQMSKFVLNGAGKGEFSMGQVEAVGEKTSTDDSTGYQLGALSSGQKIIASIHVISASGTSPTLDVKVQSDDNSDFTSASDRITFTQMVTTGGQISTYAYDVSNTDDYWRFTWTIGGSDTPTFTVLMAFGIVL